MTVNHTKQFGGVSIFVVVFACLAVTIVTVSFVSLMIRGQQQATNTDLSNSAYDSALAGVEDAKRLAIVYKGCKDAGTLGNPGPCLNANNAVTAQECNTVQTGLGIGTDEEVAIQSSTGDVSSQALDQAYTCVKLLYATPDVRREVRADATQLVELRGVSAYTTVRLSWHTREGSGGAAMVAPTPATTGLPQKSGWPTGTPSVLRAQVVQTRSGGFTLADFNNTTDTTSNSNTVFLRPVVVTTGSRPTITLPGAVDPSIATMTAGSLSPKGPQSVACGTATYDSGDYACSVNITLPTPRGGGARDNAYLVLSSFYNAADFKVELLNNGTAVNFDGVQPAVDSTGRANDLFRRISARIEFGSDNFEYPSAALDLNDSLCKAFTVTDDPDDFTSGGCDL